MELHRGKDLLEPRPVVLSDRIVFGPVELDPVAAAIERDERDLGLAATAAGDHRDYQGRGAVDFERLGWRAWLETRQSRGLPLLGGGIADWLRGQAQEQSIAEGRVGDPVEHALMNAGC